MRHYWPISEDDKCQSIKFAVEWGNSHKPKVKNSNNNQTLRQFCFIRNLVHGKVHLNFLIIVIP